MGSYAYDYLNESLLLDYSLVLQCYQTIPTSTLVDELNKYREYCLKMLADIRCNVKANNGIVSCMATNTMSTLSSLKQSALYLEEVVVSDPIFELTDFRGESAEAFNSFMGMELKPIIDKDKLAKAAIKLIELRPLVAGGYVRIYPVSFELENDKNIPVISSDVWFEDCLPKEILKKYKDSAVVRSVKHDQGRMYVLKNLFPCRNISIHYKGMEEGFNMGFILSDQFHPSDDKDKFKFIMAHDSNPPSKEDFSIWVNQSINQTARNHYIDLNKRLFLSESLGSMFVTDHSFESNLLNINIGSHDIKSNTLNCTMQMDVPFLDNISAEDLMYVRNNDGDAFQSFRSELEKGVRSARNESDPDKVRTIIEDTQHELFEVQMSQINPQVKNLRRTHFTEATIALAGLGMGFATSGLSLIATGIAGLHSMKSFSDYKSKVVANPCHFLWQAKQKAKNK